MNEATVSVPGKVILCGEHSVVYGAPALVMEAPVSMEVAVKRRIKSGIKIGEHEFAWEEVMGKTQASILSNKDGQQVADDQVTGVIMAVRELLADKVIAFGDRGIEIEVRSDIPVGSGMGSSAALGVGLVKALGSLMGEEMDEQGIFRRAMKVETLFHGTPSGADVAACVWGGVLQFQKLNVGIQDYGGDTLKVLLDDGQRQVRRIGELPEFVKENLVLIDTGRPAESTGELVASVRELGDRRDQFVRKQSEVVGQLIECLADEVFDRRRFVTLIKESERNLEEIEVVSEWGKRIIGEIVNLGGVAKVSGAGGRQREVGLVLAWHDDPEVVRAWAKERNFVILS